MVDEWNGLATLLTDLIEKYGAAVLEEINQNPDSDPDGRIAKEEMRRLDDS